MILNKIGFFEEYRKNVPPYFLLYNENCYDVGRVVSYLESGLLIRRWQEYKTCCFRCGAKGSDLGSGELTDGHWVWTEDIIHYTKFHNIALPKIFLDHLIDNDFSLIIPDDIRDRLIKEREEYQDNLRFSEELVFSKADWTGWLDGMEGSVDEKIINDLVSSIIPFREKEESFPVDIKLPDSWP
jgi:hypothetical protein|tara:strand:+ start:543 stop:1094 length:552 start_codon:yes stop_codon:yes gene_type:complete